jgi:hypothetical protein
MNKQRLYKTGTKWCFWRWTIVDSEYITRLHVIKTPWFAICVHWLNKADPEPWLHDHPVSFLSLILRGGYKEMRYNREHCRIQYNNWFNFVLANPNDRHSIMEVQPNTVTVCFMGPKTREWGFHTTDGWVHWKDYYTKQRAKIK